MAIVKRIVFTIAVIYILSECIPTSAGSYLSAAQYSGIWYRVGILIPNGPPIKIMCEWFMSTPRTSCTGCFDETYGQLRDGRSSMKVYGSGLVINSEVHVTYPSISKVLHAFAATTYNRGEEVVLRDKSNVRNSKVLSRTTTISEETKAVFERLAESAGLQTQYIEPNACSV